MRSTATRSLLVLFVLATALSGAAAGPSRWKKAYFGATTPGAWARTRTVNTVNGDTSEILMTRRPDQDGQVVIEQDYEVKSGQFKGTVSRSRNVMKEGFPLEMEGLSYLRWAETSEYAGSDGKWTAMDAETVRIIASTAQDYGAIVVFKGTETVDGKACDHYAWSYVDKALGKREGEYWLSDQVPFAVVKEVASGKDATKASYRLETRLVESGVRPELAKAVTPVVTLVDLYKAGRLAIQVDVLPQSSKVRLTITNKGEKKLEVVVPKGTTTLPNDSPVRELVLVADAERKLQVPAGGSAPAFEMTQKGSYRPTKGSFTLSFYNGTPLFSGSVEMGHVKE